MIIQDIDIKERRKTLKKNVLGRISIIFSLIFTLILPFVQPILASSNPSIQYRTHVQDIGWTDQVSDGGVSGTTGHARRMEAIVIDSSFPIKYQVHVQDKGWRFLHFDVAGNFRNTV